MPSLCSCGVVVCFLCLHAKENGICHTLTISGSSSVDACASIKDSCLYGRSSCRRFAGVLVFFTFSLIV
jgi:hypothetical protein